MKATIAQLKKKIQKLVADTGTDLHRQNPYWMNEKHIGYMREALEQVVVSGHSDPDRYFTPTENQVKSLREWINGLHDKYLLGN